MPAYDVRVTSAPELAPGVPADYYERILRNEEGHWWYVGMLSISAALLGDRLTRSGRRLLDAGCGTGGFLRWARGRGVGSGLAGVDLASAAIELAAASLPGVDFHVAPLRALPFEDASFDLVVSNDVLQHVHEQELFESLGELRRVLAPTGSLLLRTNGARRFARERDDWRRYDRRSLATQLEGAGFDIERVTYANTLLSTYAALRGRAPRAPSKGHDGIPPAGPSKLASYLGAGALAAEARWLAGAGRTLPYGHTLFAVAARA